MQGIDRHRLRRKNSSTVLLPLPESKSILLDWLIFLSEMDPRHAERAGQESRLPPAAGGRRDSWRSSQRRQRRAGAAVGFGNCKRACEASSSPSAPAKRQFSPVGLSCFFVRANRRRTSNPKDLAFALCKVLTGTGSGAKIVQQSFCPCQKVSQSFWIGLFFYPRWTRGMRSVPGKNPDCRLRREEGGILGAAVKGDSDEQERLSALETA